MNAEFGNRFGFKPGIFLEPEEIPWGWMGEREEAWQLIVVMTDRCGAQWSHWVMVEGRSSMTGLFVDGLGGFSGESDQGFEAVLFFGFQLNISLHRVDALADDVHAQTH